MCTRSSALSNKETTISCHHLINHIFDFLDRRPVSSTWKAAPEGFNNASANPFRNVPTAGPQTVLDTIHHEDPKSIAEKPGWVRCIFLPNCWFDQALSSSNPFWTRSFQASSVHNMYSVLYHGGLTPSTPGLGSMFHYPGIYSKDNFEEASSCAYSSQIRIPGVWFQVVFEIARRVGTQYPEWLEPNSNNYYSIPVNVVLLAVWIKVRLTSQLENNDMLFVHPSVLWSPEYEANPLDPAWPVIFQIRKMDVDMVYLH